MKESDVPLYLNGWHAFKTHPELLDDIHWPDSQYFVEDHTSMILKEIDSAISGKKGTPTNPQWVHSKPFLISSPSSAPPPPALSAPDATLGRLHLLILFADFILAP